MKIAAVFGIALTIFLMGLTACEKYTGNAEGDVELYLLKSFENQDQSGSIDESSVVIESEPLLAYAEFLSYNPHKHIFKIIQSAAKKIENLEHSVQGLPFAILANGELIYTAYFWPSYSSATCAWVVTDPLMISGKNELHMRLGYPGLLEGMQIPDERNNETILDIFRRDGKLID